MSGTTVTNIDRRTRGRLPFAGALFCAVIGARLLSAQSAGDETLTQARAIASSYRFVLAADEAPRVPQLSQEPLFSYSDAARVIADSSIWLWTEGGRPVGVLALELYPKPDMPGVWSFEVLTLRREPTRVVCAGQTWELRDAHGIEQPLAAAAPSDRRAARLLQMKQLARSFDVVSTSEKDGRVTLRLLPNPLYRYPEDATAALDGAAFAFAYGTNPEALLVLECTQSDRTAWRFGIFPLGSGQLSAQRDGAEVWTLPRYTGAGTRTGYINGRVPLAAVATPEG
jgi:hypothetical protein